MAVGVVKKISGLNGENNTGGLTQRWWFAPVADFAIIKGLKAVGVSGDAVTIDGTHTFTGDKGFYENYASQNENMIKLENVGERDNETFKASFEAYVPGNSKELAETLSVLKNTDVLVLVESNTGEVEQLGSALLPIRLTASYDSGKAGSGKKGWTIKGECFQNGKQFYCTTADVATAITLNDE